MIRILTVVFVILICSCGQTRNCVKNLSRYYKFDLDTTKEYRLEGTYCISSIRDTVLANNESSILKFQVDDRKNGNKLEKGIVFVYGNDTTQINFDKYQNEIMVKSGTYKIEAWAVDNIGKTTKKIKFMRNQIVEIRFFLGSSLIH